MNRVNLLILVLVCAFVVAAVGVWRRDRKDVSFQRGISSPSTGGMTEDLVAIGKMIDEMDAHKEGARRRLLCNTDHARLLASCRELLRRMTSGDLRHGIYYFRPDPSPEITSFPGVIVELGPTRVYVRAGVVTIEMMGGMDHFGVNAVDEGVTVPQGSSGFGNKELIPGLWYYDDGYDESPRYGKMIDALMEKRGD